MFRAVCYRPDECQIITTGTDRKIGYWETYDGSQIREVDGSKSDSINGMDIYGGHFVTGGGDRVIKVSGFSPFLIIGCRGGSKVGGLVMGEWEV